MKNPKSNRHFECHRADCKHVNSKRTLSQNSALHVYFQLIADELNGAGLPIKATLEHYDVDLDWSSESVKSLVWRPIQKALLGKRSTTELKKQQDIDRVYEHINRFLSEQFGIHVPFPVNPDKQKEKQYIGSKETVPYQEEHTKTAFED